MYSTHKFVFAFLLLFGSNVYTATLPVVTGLELNGDVLSWDAQDGADGYNIHLNYQYFDTVRGATTYTVSAPGDYHIISFNNNGEFGVTREPEEGGQPFNRVTYEGSNESVNYTDAYYAVYVYQTCKDVGPGESCIAQCPRPYRPPNSNRDYYPTHVSGGACSTSDIVEADAFVNRFTYKCTLPTFSGEVVAQAICAIPR